MPWLNFVKSLLRCTEAYTFEKSDLWPWPKPVHDGCVALSAGIC